MRLLRAGDSGELSLVEHTGGETPPYAILSHTWGDDGDEVTLRDIVEDGGNSKPGYRKLRFCAKQAASDGLKLFWVDTCCIDKASSAELQEAINSMYQWYQRAEKCYVYLTDVSTGGSVGSNSSTQHAWKQAFQDSKWFTRGWTLQELLAPASVEFFSTEGVRLGTKVELLWEIHTATAIPLEALQGAPLTRFKPETRLSWVERRKTKRPEDKAYALLGIFGVYMPLLYGEGESNAFRRLEEEIQKSSKYGKQQASIQTYHAEPEICRGVERGFEAPWVVPLPRPPSFVGRKTELARLHEHILPVSSQRLAIYGLGGCGKTAIALEAAYRVKEHQPVCAVFWVPAVSRQSFEQAYRDIGTALNIPGIAEANADVKRLVRVRLSNENVGPWLMVVDNADDVSILLEPLEVGGGGERLIDFVPHSSKGSVLFTTRTRKAAVDLVGGNALQLGELDEREAEELLKTRLLPDNHIVLEDKEIVHEFLDMLAFLALAIVQAVAFINKNNSSLKDYLSMYKDSEEDAIELLSKDFEEQGRYRDTKNPVATTWYISFTQMQREDQLAAEYLYFMACTAGQRVPVSLLPFGSSRMAKMEAIGTLNAYAFIAERQQPRGKEVREGERMFDMHRLVCLASRNWLRDQQQWKAWVNKTLNRLIEVVPYGGHERREMWAAYLPHAIHVVSLSVVCEAEGRISLLDRIGRCEHSLGRYQSAEVAHRQVLEQRKAMLGKEHPHTLTSMNNVALALSDQGKSVEAEKMHRETLVLREKILGKEHPDTLMSMSDIAQALSDQGKDTEAEKIHRETLALREKVLGKEHPHTLISMSNVALALSEQGKYVDAEKIHRETLAMREKVLGIEHPDTLTSIYNAAHALSDQGKYAEAEKMHREEIALCEKVLGKEHPDTLTGMDSVAQALKNQGKYDEAEKIYQETLALREKMLGKEHPDTLTSMSGVALALSNQGKYAEAEKMHRETLALREKVLGKKHPCTLTSMNNVALALSDQGQYAEAERMHRETLALREKVSGKEHPHTLTTMNNMALALINQGKYAEAETMLRETLVLREKMLGKEHPGTLKSMSNVALALGRQGKYADAEKIYRETMALQEKVLGIEHPDTLTSTHWVAYTLHQQCQYDSALALYDRAYTGYHRTLGSAHPTTQACLAQYFSLRQICDLDLSTGGVSISDIV